MASADKITSRAIVCHDKLQNGGWKMDTVTLREPHDDELVIEMVASGICHTDALVGSIDPSPISFYPRILGHEGRRSTAIPCYLPKLTWKLGSGYVRAIGSKVTVASPGDPVLLSFTCCSSCSSCVAKHSSVCYSFNDINFGRNNVFSLASDSDPKYDIGGKFFGQSSFANFTIVDQKSVVNAKRLVRNDDELKLFAPLGCGIQTGSGTVINVAKAGEDDAVAVLGMGGVGLSAIMAAKIRGCRMIIGIDRVSQRLELAKELGATHVVDSSKLPEGKTLVDVVREIADGVGPTVTVDTTGVPALIQMGIEFTRYSGKAIQVGTAPADANLTIPIFPFMVAGKTYTGAVQGDSTPSEYVPQMVEWYRKRMFPIDRLIKLMPADEYERALHEMHSGETVKPVIVW